MKAEKARRGTWLRTGILLVLVVAAFGLWLMDGQPAEKERSQPTPVPTAAAQDDRRSSRENAYDRDVAALQALLDSGAADEATQELAAQKLAALISEHESEIGLEKALMEAGYENAVVLVQNGAATVMVPSELLNESSSAQILTLCVVHAGVEAENVRVMGNSI